MNTQFGAIARLATTVEVEPSPLQKEIATITRVVAVIAVVMGAAFFAIGLATGLGLWVSTIFGIGIIVANVPEGLLPTVTLSLAMAAQRMAGRQALIKQLTSVETLGCTTVICTDKTGTLTENRMHVDRLYADGVDVEVGNGWSAAAAAPGVPYGPLLEAIVHCNNAKPMHRSGGRRAIIGDPTEVALLEFALNQGPPDDWPLPRMGELPFDADRKRMSTLHWSGGRLIAFVKGAPESVLPLCERIAHGGHDRVLTDAERQRLAVQIRSLAQRAYRVLAVATREIVHGPQRLDADNVERALTFLGLVALMDPPRREVPAAVATCRKAGVRIVMITGDHPLTALAIARRIGLVPGEPPGSGTTRVIEGTHLDALADAALRRLLACAVREAPPVIFARMAARHKMRVVTMLKAMGEVVAVTGDGVNDAPALKQADIGIAMGVAGTDVAKESADMILLDDNFATIVSAIEEGRAVYANIRRFVTYVLSSNVPEIVPYLGYGLFAIPLALTVPQILAVDLGTDMVPALALGAERPHAGVMTAPPRSRNERLLSVPLLLRAYAFIGLIEAALAMAAFFGFLYAQGWTWGDPLAWTDPLYRQASTATLAAIVVAQVANVYACRSARDSVFRLGWFTNPLIVWGIAIELILLALLVYTPFGNLLVGTSPLPTWIWGPLMLGSVGLLLVEEARKLIVRSWGRG